MSDRDREICQRHEIFTFLLKKIWYNTSKWISWKLFLLESEENAGGLMACMCLGFVIERAYKNVLW